MNFFDRKYSEPAADERTEALARAVIGAAIEVHRILGPGLPESVYKLALSHELNLRAIPHECEFPLPVTYKGEPVGLGRMDIFVDGLLVVELKTVDALNEVHRGQVIAYLHVTNRRLGLLINFNVSILKDGIKRVINSSMRK
jgi:GxxExxY protein